MVNTNNNIIVKPSLTLPNTTNNPNSIYHPDEFYTFDDIVNPSRAFQLESSVLDVSEIEIDSFFKSLHYTIGGIEIYTHKLYCGSRYTYQESVIDTNGSTQIITHSYPDDNIYIVGEPSMSDYKNGISVVEPIPVGKIYRNLGIIEFFFDITPIQQGVDNIRVTYILNDDRMELIRYKYGNKVAIGNDLRIIFYRNNIVYFTGFESIFYIPFTNTISIGDSGSDIIGFSKLSDTTIAVFKDEKDDNIYYINATTSTIDKRTEVAFVTKGGIIGEKAVNNSTSCILANDPLYLSKNGVYSLKVGDNVTTSERYTFERSGFVNSKLSKIKNLSEANAIVHNNRYYLSIGEDVFVADSRYKSSARDQDMNDTFNYEWWYWEGVPVKQWFIDEDKLCFLSNNGYIAEFTEERSDVKLHALTHSDWSMVVNSDNYVQLNSKYADLLKNTNKILCEGVVYDIVTDDNTLYNYQFKLMRDDNIVDTELVNSIFYSNFAILEYKNVVSEWYSPIVNMGTSIYAKNLITSTLTFEPDVEGDVKFGYITRRKPETTFKGSSLSPDDGLDFENIDFTDFSFNVNFACSRTLKTRTRNYNYIQFRIVSDSNKDCALNNFVVTYTYGRKNKGVR